jgi:hypothetical protein
MGGAVVPAVKREEFGYRERLRKGARREGDVTVYPPSSGFGGGKLADEKLERHYDTCSAADCRLCAGIRERALLDEDEADA